jgi:16S rRNA processing protein RimM
MAIAHIVRAHGVHGEVNAIVLAPPVLDGAELIEDRRLFARDPKGNIRVMQGLSVRPHQDRWLITLEGIETMDEANALRNVDLCLPRAELPELPEGWYWESDLELCRVVDRTLGEIGSVKGLNLSLVQPQLEVKRPDGTIALIPWVKAFIVEVNLEACLVLTDLPPGFPGISASPTAV